MAVSARFCRNGYFCAFWCEAVIIASGSEVRHSVVAIVICRSNVYFLQLRFRDVRIGRKSSEFKNIKLYPTFNFDV